jgi:hypothetical protein
MAALHDYAPLFLSDLLKESAAARKHYSLNVPTLTLKGRVTGDEAVVMIDKIAFRLTVPDAGISVDYDGKCATIKGAEGFFGLDGGPICGDELSKQAIPGLKNPDIGITAVREGGFWYVSPSRTVLDGIIGILQSLQPRTLDELKQFFQSFAFGGFGGFGGGSFELPAGFPTAAPHA